VPEKDWALLHRLTGAVQSEAPTVPMTLDTVIGGAKELLNQFIASQAAMSAQWMGDNGIVSYQDTQTGETLPPDQAAERYRNEGNTPLPIAPEEQAGAQVVHDAPHPLAIIAATAIASRGQSVVRNPEQIAKDIKEAVINSRSPSEALGKAGMN